MKSTDLVLMLGVLLVLGSLSQARAQAPALFDLPAQSLADSLRAIAARTHSNILFDRTLVVGREAKAIKGAATTEQALQQLLSGTDLTYRRLDEKTVTLILLPASERARTQAESTKPAAEESHAGSQGSGPYVGQDEHRVASGYERSYS